MTLAQLKTSVLAVEGITGDWVKDNFGDRRLKATWQAAYDYCVQFMALAVEAAVEVAAVAVEKAIEQAPTVVVAIEAAAILTVTLVAFMWHWFKVTAVESYAAGKQWRQVFDSPDVHALTDNLTNDYRFTNSL